jgi:hypothetical protein
LLSKTNGSTFRSGRFAGGLKSVPRNIDARSLLGVQYCVEDNRRSAKQAKTNGFCTAFYWAKGKNMRKILALMLALGAAVSVSACQTPQQQTGTLAGGAIGAGTGALVGSALSHGSAGGAIAGGVIGAGTGALVGNAVTQPSGRCAQWGYDYNGNQVCTAFYWLMRFGGQIGVEDAVRPLRLAW